LPAVGLVVSSRLSAEATVTSGGAAIARRAAPRRSKLAHPRSSATSANSSCAETRAWPGDLRSGTRRRPSLDKAWMNQSSDETISPTRSSGRSASPGKLVDPPTTLGKRSLLGAPARQRALYSRRDRQEP
jgi:hypothetical protein